MKAINTLSVLFFLLVAVACSSESDTIMNDIDKEVSSTSEMYASFGVSLAADEIQTRSVVESGDDESANSNEVTVKNCYIAVFDQKSGNLLGSHLYTAPEVTEKDGVYTLGKNIVFKVSGNVAERPDLTIVAVANMNPNDDTYGSQSSIRYGIQNCYTYDDLMDFQLSETPYVLVKVGEIHIASDKYEEYMHITPSMFPDQNDIKPINISVKQRAAAIEVNTLTINSSVGEVENCKIETIWLENMVLYTKVGKYQDDENFIMEESTVVRPENAASNNLLHYRFCTYGNGNESNKTAVCFTYSYTLDGKSETGSCSFTIKTPDTSKGSGYSETVEANHLYKLDVTITNGTATATIKCSVNDWVDNETIEIPVKGTNN